MQIFINKRTIYFDVLPYSFKANFIRLTLSLFKGKTIRYNHGLIPIPEDKKNYKKFNLKKSMIFFSKKCLKNYLLPNYFVITGSYSKKFYQLNAFKNIKTQYIYAHNSGYNEYLDILKNKVVKTNNSLVFLDEDMVNHTDYIFRGIKPFSTADNYFYLVNNFLKNVSKTFSLKPIIAAHPKSNIDQISRSFKFKCYIDKTYELILKSDLVITHSSTIIEFAVLLKKPLLFITTNQLNSSIYGERGLSYGDWISNYAKELNKKVFNLDEHIDLKELQKETMVDNKFYEKYIRKYIKTNKTDYKFSWEIISDNIKLN